jgi:hypothetical protein
MAGEHALVGSVRLYGSGGGHGARPLSIGQGS